MTSLWSAVLPTAPADADAAPLTVAAEGGPAGQLCRWHSVKRPHPRAVQARRAVLSDGRPCAVTLLTDDPVHITGALSVARRDRPEQVAALEDDPFARLWPARLLRVGPGVLGALVRPTGPCLERYGGRPWPNDRFPEQPAAQQKERP